jgi:hypothetical protein
MLAPVLDTGNQKRKTEKKSNSPSPQGTYNLTDQSKQALII